MAKEKKSNPEPSAIAKIKTTKTCIIFFQALCFLLGISALILEYGFFQTSRTTGEYFSISPVAPSLLNASKAVATMGFILIFWSQIAFLPGRKSFLKDHIVELKLSVLAAVALVLQHICISADYASDTVLLSENTLSWIDIGLIIYLVIQLLIVFIKFTNHMLKLVVSPARATLVGFLIFILAGASLLSLPSATYSNRFTDYGNNFVDNLFTATSAVCVTGLIVRDTGSDYTPFGQLVILLLIQSGGLGIIIFGTVFAVLIGRAVSLKETNLMMDIYNQRAAGQIQKLVKFILIATLSIEAIGAIFLYSMWSGADAGIKIYKSVFHSISAFCNAGFALQNDNMMSLADTWQMYVIVPALIIIGGLGFPVLINISHVVKTKFFKLIGKSKPTSDLDLFRVVRFTLQTKIVLLTSFLLIIGPALMFFFFETPDDQQRWGRKVEYEDIAIKSNTGEMSEHSNPQRFLDAFFLAVTSRTAGFNSVDTSSGRLHPASMIVLIILMTIGGSPASTAGGIKTVTFAILIAAVISSLRNRRNVELFNRTIDYSLIRRALSLSIIFVGLVCTVTLSLVLTHPQMNFLDLLFEASSACGTVGLSTGVTPHLNLAGRIIIIIAMFAGRLGPLTLLFAMAGRQRKIGYEFPREDLITG